MENDENYPERFETILDSWFSDSNFQVYQITWTTTSVICYENMDPRILETLFLIWMLERISPWCFKDSSTILAIDALTYIKNAMPETNVH